MKDELKVVNVDNMVKNFLKVSILSTIWNTHGPCIKHPKNMPDDTWSTFHIRMCIILTNNSKTKGRSSFRKSRMYLPEGIGHM